VAASGAARTTSTRFPHGLQLNLENLPFLQPDLLPVVLFLQDDRGSFSMARPSLGPRGDHKADHQN